jgi:hypothetical protein
MKAYLFIGLLILQHTAITFTQPKDVIDIVEESYDVDAINLSNPSSEVTTQNERISPELREERNQARANFRQCLTQYCPQCDEIRGEGHWRSLSDAKRQQVRDCVTANCRDCREHLRGFNQNRSGNNRGGQQREIGHAGNQGRPSHAGNQGRPSHAGNQGRPSHAGNRGASEGSRR